MNYYWLNLFEIKDIVCIKLILLLFDPILFDK